MFSISSEIPTERQAYQLDGGPVGVLMLHGFMGSPYSSRPLGMYLQRCGMTIHCPRLAGHGHLPARLENGSRRVWLEQAESALQSLRRCCSQVYLVGHSMGCVIGAHLAVRHPIDGFVMVAPLYSAPHKAIYAMALLRHIRRWLYPLKMGKLFPREIVEERILDFKPDIDLEDPDVQAWLIEGTKIPTKAFDEMRKMASYGRRLWPQIDSDVLILQGEADRAVDPLLAQRLYEQLGSSDKQIQMYADSDHGLIRPEDPAHLEAWQQIARFILLRAQRSR